MRMEDVKIGQRVWYKFLASEPQRKCTVVIINEDDIGLKFDRTENLLGHDLGGYLNHNTGLWALARDITPADEPIIKLDDTVRYTVGMGEQTGRVVSINHRLNYPITVRSETNTTNIKYEELIFETQ